jgi:hypothetical protein
MEGDFPFKIVKLKLSGKRVSRSPGQALEADWGYHTTLTLFNAKNIIQQEDFHLVWWDGLCTTMNNYPKMYRVWLTKTHWIFVAIMSSFTIGVRVNTLQNVISVRLKTTS